ncbi:MAG: DUF6644 family protein [Acidobacteriota bacterium]
MHLSLVQWDATAKWLQTTSIAFAMRDYPWLWAGAETVHFLGLAMLIGAIGVLDLRVLGVAKQMPVGPLHQLVPWGIAGFVLNLITGIMFFCADALQYSHNIAFQFKMLFIALAGFNVLYFYVGGVFHKVEALGPGADAPFNAKFVAASSIFLWFGVMYWGRMLPFVGTAF